MHELSVNKYKRDHTPPCKHPGIAALLREDVLAVVSKMMVRGSGGLPYREIGRNSIDTRVDLFIFCFPTEMNMLLCR